MIYTWKRRKVYREGALSSRTEEDIYLHVCSLTCRLPGVIIYQFSCQVLGLRADQFFTILTNAYSALWGGSQTPSHWLRTTAYWPFNATGSRIYDIHREFKPSWIDLDDKTVTWQVQYILTSELVMSLWERVAWNTTQQIKWTTSIVSLNTRRSKA